MWIQLSDNHVRALDYILHHALPHCADDADGNHIRYFEADTLYRESLGVTARYDKNGRLKTL